MRVFVCFRLHLRVRSCSQNASVQEVSASFRFPTTEVGCPPPPIARMACALLRKRHAAVYDYSLFFPPVCAPPLGWVAPPPSPGVKVVVGAVLMVVVVRGVLVMVIMAFGVGDRVVSGGYGTVLGGCGVVVGKWIHVFLTTA